MKATLRTLLVLLVGFVGGAIAMGLLSSYVRPIDRDVMRANFVAQQRFAATHAARAGDALGGGEFGLVWRDEAYDGADPRVHFLRMAPSE